MVYFTDYFDVDESIIEQYGAFNISLINDLPLFIDPFLLFGSPKEEYQQIHSNILKYLGFLKNKSEQGITQYSQIKSWYTFSEVKQNWFGYSQVGNKGSGLGRKFGESFSKNLHLVFDDLGKERITQTSHIEKAGLFEIGVGRDNISDFTCNLIKYYLLGYTENFALKYLNTEYVKKVKVNKAYFDYELERWMPKVFTLPYIFNDFVLLTPKDILTKDENWINSHDLKNDFTEICNSIPNDQLRNEIFNYFQKKLPINKTKKQNTQKEISQAVYETIKKYPEIIKYYIKKKEENKIGAKNISQQKVSEVETTFVHNVKNLIQCLASETEFYNEDLKGSFEEALSRINYMKKVIEDNDGYKLFYVNGIPIKRESDLQIIYKLTWYATPYDVNREANNGRGPVDYAISKGAKDKTLVEFKLASNSKLKQNLMNQVAIYEKANETNQSIKVILYFDDNEYNKVSNILKELKLDNNKSIILIDAGRKESASNVK
jgi:hypothetical protein